MRGRNSFGAGRFGVMGSGVGVEDGIGRAKCKPGLRLASEDDYLGDREGVGMRDGHQDGLAARRREAPFCGAVQLKLRGPAAADDFNVAPEHALGVPGSERLHRRLFRGKPAREMNGRDLAPHAVRRFAVGEHSAQESVAVPFDGGGDTIDVSGV